MAEPIFSRQEQGVVYLFSRYWDKLRDFEGKRICNIHTHFPDFSLEDIKTGEEEAVEFEYARQTFYSHLPGDVKKLKENDIKVLYIVYWDEDVNREELLRKIGRHFKGKVNLVKLSEYFSPVIKPEKLRLGAYWEFRGTKCFDKVYPLKEIEAKTQKLEDDGVVQPLRVNAELYRLAGFNKSNSEFIECDQWQRIHFYTTTYFHEDSVPSRLFVKPTGSRGFSGFFEVRRASRIVDVKDKLLTDYFEKFYFYPYEEYEPKRLKKTTCLVYSDFTPLDDNQGVKIYNYLVEQGYNVGQSSELVNDSDDIAEMNGIVDEKKS